MAIALGGLVVLQLEGRCIEMFLGDTLSTLPQKLQNILCF